MAVSRHIRAARWGGALLVALAPLPWLGMGSAQAADAVVYATVTGHEAFSPEANQADYWGDDCEKIVDGGSLESYVLTQDYALVVVKSASKNVDPYTNTLFENASEGETVWADTNGNFTFDPGGQDGDKAISHIIVCSDDQASTPPPVSSSEEPTPSESESTDEPSPSESESTDEPSPSESESTEPASSEPEPSTSEPEPSTSEPEPSESDFSSSPAPARTNTPNSEPEATETASSGAAALPKTGAGTPVAGAIGISLLLIGVGILLLLGPGRLIPATYHRKH